MKILGISGSPRKGGNSDILLEKALEGASASGCETEKIVLNDLNISPCQEEEYEKVNDDGLSIVADDIHTIFQKIKECDALILASPIFFGSLSSQTKIMIDRFQCVWVSKTMLKKDIFSDKKIGGLILVEATKREDFLDNARSIAGHFFATINVEKKGDVSCMGVDRKASVLDKSEAIEAAYQMGKMLAETAKS